MYSGLTLPYSDFFSHGVAGASSKTSSDEKLSNILYSYLVDLFTISTVFINSLTLPILRESFITYFPSFNSILDNLSLYLYSQVSFDTSRLLTSTSRTFSFDSPLNTYLVSSSNFWNSLSSSEKALRSAQETSDLSRRQRASSPVVGYNFKVGDFYPSTTLKFYPSVFRSLSDVTRGVRRSA